MSVYLDGTPKTQDLIPPLTEVRTENEQANGLLKKSHKYRQLFEEVVVECLALARLGCPVILSYFSQLLVFQLALRYAGTILGDTALAGAGMGLMFSNCFGLSVIIGMANALDTLLFQVYGANPRSPLISVYVQRALLVLFLCCLPLSALWFYAGEFLRFTGQDPEVVVLAEAFIRVNLINLYLNILYEVIRKLLTCIHNLNIVSMISITLTLISPFIFKSLVHAFGIIGMSFTISIFYTVMIFVCICELLFRYRTFAGMWHAPSRAVFRHWGEFLKLGLPSSLMLFFEWGLFEVNGLASGRFGEKALDTMTICMQVLTVIYMVPLGLNIALCVRVGNGFGAKDLPAVRRAVFASIAMICFVVSVDVLLMWFTRFAVPRFFTNSAAIMEKYADVTPVIMCFHIFDGIMCICNGIIKGMGYPLYGTFFLALAYVVGVPFGWFLAFRCNLEVKGLWVGPAMGLCLADMLYILFFLRIDWNRVMHRASKRIARGTKVLEKN